MIEVKTEDLTAEISYKSTVRKNISFEQSKQ